MNHFVITCWGHVAPGKQCKTQLIQHVMPAVEPTCSEASKVNSRNHSVPGIQDILNQFIPWQYIPSNPWHPTWFRILGYVDNFPELLHILNLIEEPSATRHTLCTPHHLRLSAGTLFLQGSPWSKALRAGINVWAHLQRSSVVKPLYSNRQNYPKSSQSSF